MEREILFRGFCPSKNGKQIITLDGKDYRGDWVEGFYAEDDNLDPVQVLGEALGFVKTVYKKKEVTPCIIDKEYGEWRPILPETVGQFTGLTDKNGKKIFEGDILQASPNSDNIGPVYYEDAQWFGARDYLAYAVAYGEAEVIGNIHDKEE